MYKTFQLPTLPPRLEYEIFIRELTAAHRALAQIDALVSHLPNPKILERSFITKEAVLSSRIEGTQLSIGDVLGYDAGEILSSEPRKEDALEIVNYRDALEMGLSRIDAEPIGENMVKKLHAILLNSGRGARNTPGEFRSGQVYIGRPGVGIDLASYVPPAPNEIAPLFQNLLHYIHSTDEKDDLVRIAVTHYQFEAIRPFFDGNGRVGRLLITLLLHDKKLLRHPYLYLSEFFEANRPEYYESLRAVSENQDWSAWVGFFLHGITWQSNAMVVTVEKIYELQKRLQPQLVAISSEYGLRVLDALFERPVFGTKLLRERAGLQNIQTTYTIVEKLVAAGIIRDTTPDKRRGKQYEFSELLSLIRSDY